MRIANLETTPYALPFREPYVSARGRLERRELLLVRLRTDEGLVGLGEAAPLALRGGASLAAIEEELRGAVAPALAGADVGGLRERDPGIVPALYGAANLAAAGPGSAGISRQALAAIEIALWDLAGKAAGVPAWRLLGVDEGRPVECNATLSAAAPEAVAADAVEWAERGFGTFKLKLGAAGDVAQARAVREALGPEARVRVDANESWEPERAPAILDELAELDIELAEQPVAGLEGLAALRARTSVPIAADESLVTVLDAERAAEIGACDMATVKLAKVGGIDAARAIATRVPVYLSSALDGPVGIAAAGHAAQALRDRGDAGLAHGLATGLLFAGTVAAVEPRIERGELRLGDGPGLGVELDEAALERCRL